MNKMTPSTSWQSRMIPEVAKRRIASFGKRFGQAHLYLAYHAAFPLALTPDLLYRLWANFPCDIRGKQLNIPWVAVADLLLSSLCEEVGYELYEMNVALRNELLSDLKADPNFGAQRITELSKFLLSYVDQRLNSLDPSVSDFARTQQWTALVYMNPDKAARKLADALSKLNWNDRAEQVRMASLVETFAEQLEGFTPLLIYAKGLAHYGHGEMEDAKVLFNMLAQGERLVQLEGINLKIPTLGHKKVEKEREIEEVQRKIQYLEQAQAIRTIFFDAGFTLIRPHPSDAEICQQVCQQLDLHIHLDEFKKRLLAADDYYYRQMRLNRHIWANEQAINEFWIDYYMNLLRPLIVEHDETRLYQLAQAITQEFDKPTRWQTYPDVLPTLKALRAHGYTLGVISDWGIALGPILRRLHLTTYFACILVSAVIRHAKPSSSLYELALQRANAIADYTLHIGDSYIHDVLGARSVGITPILLDRGHHLQENDVDCLLVHSLTDLLDLLEVFDDERTHG